MNLKKIKYKIYTIIKKFTFRLRKFNLTLSLSELGKAYRTDKYELGYLDEYERFLGPIRQDAKYVIEIGIGGHDKKESGGYSLKMWSNYFKKAQIIGLDIVDKSFLNSKRIKTYKCDQSNPDEINKITTNISLDLVIDDGSHFVNHQLISFKTLFPKIKPGGFYIIEDTCGSFMKRLGGDPYLKEETTISFIKNLVFSCYSNCIIDNLTNKEIDKWIKSIYFWGSKQNNGGIVIVQKGENQGQSPNEINQEKEYLLDFDEYKNYNKKWKKSTSGLFNT